MRSFPLCRSCFAVAHAAASYGPVNEHQFACACCGSRTTPTAMTGETVVAAAFAVYSERLEMAFRRASAR